MKKVLRSRLIKNLILDDDNSLRLRAKRVCGKTEKVTLLAKQEYKKLKRSFTSVKAFGTHLLPLEVLTKHILNLLIFAGLILLPNFIASKVLAEDTAGKKLNSSIVKEDQVSPDNSTAFSNFGTTNNSAPRKYILGPNDIVNISFIGFPEFKQENIRIQPDGNILIAPVGTIRAEGMTLDQLQSKLVDRFNVIIKNPMISISLTKTKPLIVYVTGAINSPGSYELNTDTSYSNAYTSLAQSTAIDRKTPLLTNMLVAAGGITPDADIENIEISNRYENTKYKVNLLDLIEKGNTSQDIYLMSGDVINVPKLATNFAVDMKKYNSFAASSFSKKQIPVRVFGYVNSSGLVMLDAGESPRLNTAISQAGGYLNGTTSPPKSVIVSRMDNNGILSSTRVNPMREDIVLLPNDVIFVPEKTSSSVARGFDYLLRIVSPVSSFASGYNNMDYVFRD